VKAREVPVRLIADLCICQYTNGGVCGVVRAGSIDERATIAALAEQACMLADAGVDGLMPSAMIDGLTRALRGALDERGHERVLLFPESAKVASALYAPFRSATGGEVRADKR